MPTVTLGTTTTFGAAVARHTATLKDILRAAFSRTGKPQSDYIRRLKKAVLSSLRCKAVEILVAFVVDLAHRGSLEEAEGIGLQLAAIARAEYASAHPGETEVQLSFAEASIAEESAQGEMENAEEMLKHFPTLTNRLRLLAASGKYERAKRARDEAVRRQVAA